MCVRSTRLVKRDSKSVMDRMFSPWRAQHIARMTDPAAEREADDGCSLFARLAAANDDEANLILWRGTHVFVLMNRYPYNNGHLMVIPFRTVDAYDALTDAERYELSDAIAACMGWLKAALHPEGFNVGINQGEAAGAGIPDHLHVHVVPRWSADTNFMPVTAATKVIPEALTETYQKLKHALAQDIAANPA